MARTPVRETKRRLLAAASALFAERGFHGTTVRDISARAGVNLAAGNYHYGSKKELYLEVLRAQFAAIRAVLNRRHASWHGRQLQDLPRGALVGLLQARVQAMFDTLIGPPLSVHGTLMLREMCDPSEALPTIVDEFISPMLAEVEQIITHLEPGLEPEQIRRSAFSTIAQVLFYRFTMPVMLRMMGRDAYARGLSRTVAEHVTQFSIGGLAHLTADRAASARHRRARPRRARVAARRQGLTAP